MHFAPFFSIFFLLIIANGIFAGIDRNSMNLVHFASHPNFDALRIRTNPMAGPGQLQRTAWMGGKRKQPLATFGARGNPGFVELSGLRVDFTMVFPARDQSMMERSNRNKDLIVGLGYEFGIGTHCRLGNSEMSAVPLAKRMRAATEAIGKEPTDSAHFSVVDEIRELLSLCVGVAREDPENKFAVEQFTDSEEDEMANELAIETKKNDCSPPSSAELQLVGSSTQTGLTAEYLGLPTPQPKHPIHRLLAFVFSPISKLVIFLLSFCPYQFDHPRVIIDFVVDVTKGENRQMAVTVSLEFRPKEEKMFVVIKNETDSEEDLQRALKAATIVRISKDKEAKDLYQTDFIMLSSDGQMNEASKTNMEILKLLRKPVREILQQHFNWRTAAELIGRQLLRQDISGVVNSMLRKHTETIFGKMGMPMVPGRKMPMKMPMAPKMSSESAFANINTELGNSVDFEFN